MHENLVLDDIEDKDNIIGTEEKYGDGNNGSSDECNIETFQDPINAAMVKYTPENDIHDWIVTRKAMVTLKKIKIGM